MRARGTWVLPIVAIGGCRAPLATAPFPPAASPQVGQAWESGDLKLRRLSDGFYVDLAVGQGKTGRFLIDTGSYRCFATPKGERLLKSVGARQGSDGEYRLENVRLGKSPSTTIRFAPWGTNGDTTDAASDGILGIDFFRAYLVGLDLRRGTMRLWPNEQSSADPSLDWLYGVVGKKRGDPKPEGLTVLPMDFKRGWGPSRCGSTATS